MKKRKPDEWDGFDDRAMFANTVCRLIYQKNKGDIKACLLEVKNIHNFFDEHVRDIYEVIESQIPLFFLWRLNEYGAGNWDWTADEFSEQVKIATAACHEYYAESI